MGETWRQLGLDDGVDGDANEDVGSPQPVMTSNPPSSPFKPASSPDAADGDAGVNENADVSAGAGRHVTLLQAARDAGVVRRKRRGNFNRNPTGRGGFADHPENRSKGGKKRIPTSQKELKQLIAALADESIPTDEGEVQRLVAMLRGMMQSKSPVDHMEILNRLVGRQPSKVDMTSGGRHIGWNAFIAMTVVPSLPEPDAGADADVDADVEDAALLEDEARR